PLEAAPPRRHQADWRAVVVRQRLVADVRGEKELPRCREVEAPAVAGTRDDAHVRGLRRRPRAVDQVAEPDAAPALGRVEAAGAVERGDERVTGVELAGAQRQPALYKARHREPAGAGLHLPRAVGDPPP